MKTVFVFFHVANNDFLFVPPCALQILQIKAWLNGSCCFIEMHIWMYFLRHYCPNDWLEIHSDIFLNLLSWPQNLSLQQISWWGTCKFAQHNVAYSHHIPECGLWGHCTQHLLWKGHSRDNWHDGEFTKKSVKDKVCTRKIKEPNAKHQNHTNFERGK